MNCEMAKMYASCLFNFCQIVKMFSFDELGCFELTSMSYVFYFSFLLLIDYQYSTF